MKVNELFDALKSIPEHQRNNMDVVFQTGEKEKWIARTAYIRRDKNELVISTSMKSKK